MYIHSWDESDAPVITTQPRSVINVNIKLHNRKIWRDILNQSMRKSVMAQDALTAGVDTTGSSVAFARAAASASSLLIPAFSVLSSCCCCLSSPGCGRWPCPVCCLRTPAVVVSGMSRLIIIIHWASRLRSSSPASWRCWGSSWPPPPYQNISFVRNGHNSHNYWQYISIPSIIT